MGLINRRQLDSVVHVDEQLAMSEAIDRNIPVMLVLIQGDEGTKPKPILLDGFLRLYKA